MRNRYPGTCYRCGKNVKAGAGHFERAPRHLLTLAERGRSWRLQHADCAVRFRGTDQHYLMGMPA